LDLKFSKNYEVYLQTNVDPAALTNRNAINIATLTDSAHTMLPISAIVNETRYSIRRPSDIIWQAFVTIQFNFRNKSLPNCSSMGAKKLAKTNGKKLLYIIVKRTKIAPEKMKTDTIMCLIVKL
jgi:hypothetical protein